MAAVLETRGVGFRAGKADLLRDVSLDETGSTGTPFYCIAFCQERRDAGYAVRRDGRG